jgi:hypothetical protein
MLQEENLGLKRRKSDKGETLEWTDYMSLRFTQEVRTFIHSSRSKCCSRCQLNTAFLLQRTTSSSQYMPMHAWIIT